MLAEDLFEKYISIFSEIDNFDEFSDSVSEDSIVRAPSYSNGNNPKLADLKCYEIVNWSCDCTSELWLHRHTRQECWCQWYHSHIAVFKLLFTEKLISKISVKWMLQWPTWHQNYLAWKDSHKWVKGKKMRAINLFS